MSETGLPYNGSRLDRAAGRRADAGWLAEVAARLGSRSLLFWQDRCLVDADGPVVALVGAVAGETAFLGLDGEAGVFATDLSASTEAAARAAAGAQEAVDIRRLFASADAPILAHARGLLHWHRHQQFCGTCGAATESRDGGTARACLGCGRLLFQRIEPAVIALVQAPGAPRRCLLGRHRGAAANAWSTLAGFVEIGEGLEDAVRRELAEEAGVRIGAVTYQASQAWPFPSGLMIGFRAEALSDDITVDRDELQEARWFTPDEVVTLQDEHRAAGTHRGDSIEQALIQSWLSGP